MSLLQSKIEGIVKDLNTELQIKKLKISGQQSLQKEITKRKLKNVSATV